ncbi:MAG: hypothetical protein QM704_07940 [Anaeromyxobacteraceae bacterium]
MTFASKSFVLALALASAPLAARADDHDRGDRRDGDRYSDRHAPPAPQPYRPGDRYDRDGRGHDDRFDRDWRDDARNDRDDRFVRWSGYERWRDARRPAIGWRYAEWRELRRDFWELERARDTFYASGWHNPGQTRRFERWYAVRRAELERRRDALAVRYQPWGGGYAWR